MRLAIVSEHYAPYVGGIEWHIQQLAERIAAAGHVVEVLTHEEPGAEQAAKEIISGVHVRRFKVPVPSRHYAVSPGLVAYLAKYHSSYGLIHVHGYHALPALWASLLAGPVKTVFTPHYHGGGHSYFRRALHPLYRPIGRSIFARAACVIAVSCAEAKLIRRDFAGLSFELRVIPNGVDPEEFRDIEPFRPIIAPLIFSAGRLEGYKNVRATLHAMAALDESFRLCVAGDGPDRLLLQELSRELMLADRVELLGEVCRDDLCRWFKTASVYVTMSRHEAMGITIAEALAAGTPVVASDIPAHRELAAREPGRIMLVSLEAGARELAKAIAHASLLPRQPRIVLSWDDAAAHLMDAYVSLA